MYLKIESLGVDPRFSDIYLLSASSCICVGLCFQFLCLSAVLTFSSVNAGTCHTHFLFLYLGHSAPGRYSWNVCALSPLHESLSLQVYITGLMRTQYTPSNFGFFLWNLGCLQETMTAFIDASVLGTPLCQSLGHALLSASWSSPVANTNIGSFAKPQFYVTCETNSKHCAGSQLTKIWTFQASL